MDLVSKTLHHIGENTPDAFVLQIGAMDGINFDDTRGFLDKYQWPALLVEPIPDLFEELKENFKDRENYIFEQSAIATHDGVIEMLTVPPEVIIEQDLHPGYKGMSAIYPLKNGFGSDYQRDIDVKAQFGVNMEVPCLTFNSLCEKHKVEKIDVLICDAEGYDWEIFKQFDFEKYSPTLIRLEYINLTDEEKELVENKLIENGYKVSVAQDIDAVKETFWNEINQPVENEFPIDTVPYFINRYGSDKNASGYSVLYEQLFSSFRGDITSFMEIGIGTLDPSIPSSYCGIKSHNDYYTPGGSLRAWRDYFSGSNVYGVDVAEDCMISEERIKTYLGSSLDGDKVNEMLGDLTFDILIDDGLHTAEGQYQTMKNFFPRINNGGYYIIEDCGGGGDGLNVFVDEMRDKLMEIIGDNDYHFRGNVLFVRKSVSEGDVGSFEDFISRHVEINTNSMEPIIVSKPKPQAKEINSELTIVTGLWNIGRTGRDFDLYIECFKEFLKMPHNLFIYIPEEYLVWETRSKENTYVRTSELEYIKTIYDPFWEQTQKIRTDPTWFNSTGEGGWLKESPQATLEWYNPIVQSKMFLLNDATIWNPFDNDYFIWLDAGISMTVNMDLINRQRALDNIIPHLSSFLFLSYPYETQTEIHGFDIKGMNKYANDSVKYVCRGGLFGGKKEIINQANATYYSTLLDSLNEGYMGTEESIFAIMSYREPNIYDRYSLDGSGMIVKFVQALLDGTVAMENPPKRKAPMAVTRRDLDNVKTNLYILTFNFPKQLLHTIESMKKVPEWLEKPHLVLIDNSTDMEARAGYIKIAKEFDMEFIPMDYNMGICGGRQKAAEHFHESDADYMFFFEDDMTINSDEFEGEVCRNGFRKYVPNIYDIVHKIMIRDEFDFLKMSFTEVYFDNDVALPWYNVPQDVRSRDWPHYDKLPVTGVDPNAPKAEYNHIYNMDGVSYITGIINYCNWPMIVSKEGNEKMFIDTKWGHPFEQTWSSHIYQITKKGEIRSALLLASPIWHDRILHYKPEERREN